MDQVAQALVDVAVAANAADMRARIAWVGLGSNLGDSAALLRSAACALHQLPKSRLVALSAFYRTPALTADPQDAPQPDYCNAVAAVQTALAAEPLLDALLAIEREHGRIRQAGVRWQARVLDLDLLCLDAQIIEQPGLSVPHPQLQRRMFVLQPWHDIGAAVMIPGQGRVATCRRALRVPAPPLWASQA